MTSTSAEESHVTDAAMCPVCCGTFKTPKILPCGHSLCLEPCLKTLLEASSPSCPLCRQTINPPSPDAGAEDFLTNYALQSMISTRRKRRLEPPVKINHEECQLHGEKVDVVCETCMELLCGTCIRQPHDEDHVTKTISEVAVENVSTLDNIEEELIESEALLAENEKSVEETTTRCKTEASRLHAEVDEGAAAVTTLLQEKVEYLHGKVGENLTLVEKRAGDFSLRNTNLKHVINYARYNKNNLVTTPGKSEIQRSVGVRELSKTSQKIRQDIVAVRTQLVDDERELTMPSDIVSAAWFDQARCGVEHIGQRKYASASLIRTFQHEPLGDLLGFVMYSFDEIYHVSYSDGELTFTPVNHKMNVSRGGLKQDVMTMSPLLGSGNAILFNSSQQVKSVRETLRAKSGTGFSFGVVGVGQGGFSFGSSGQEYSVTASRDGYVWKRRTANLFHLADPLLRIRAVSWDESREHCYAILSDNISIIQLKLGGTSDERSSVKLSEPIYVKSSNEFHVGASGGMAICDTPNKTVRYFASVQSQATRIIRSPPELAGGTPKCIMSRDSDHKWFVFWEGTPESEFGGIYQYSDCFEIEQFVLNAPNLMSFNFLDDRFLAILKPHPTSEDRYQFEIFMLQ